LPVAACVSEAAAHAVGARHIAGADATVAGHRLACHVADFGAAGLLGAQKRWIYRELGLVPEVAAAQAAGSSGGITEEVVFDAIRNLTIVPVVARSPLAHGDTVAERAESVRRRIAEAADGAFGDSAGERLLHEVLVRGYVEPAASHEVAAHELSLSRSAYFRRLHTAVARVAEIIVGQERDGVQAPR
jgi:hypothetical protein